MSKSIHKPETKILVGTHHKAGTLWLLNIFRAISREFNLTLFKGEQKNLPKDYDIFFNSHTEFDLTLISNYRGIHIIRDPRDMLISGCFYHQISTEEWLFVPRKKFNGLTYQEKLKSYNNFDDQLLFEIENVWQIFKDDNFWSSDLLSNWSFKNEYFFEIKYEDLVSDSDLLIFQEMFSFLGFSKLDIKRLKKIAYENSLFSGKVKKTGHIRSGKTKQWQTLFKPVHHQLFNSLYPDLLKKLNYPIYK